MLLKISDISFMNYIPTTIIGLVGLVSGYLYFYFRNKDNNKLQQIQAAKPQDRIKVIEMTLNDIGVTIDTSTLDSNQKFMIIEQMLKAKTRKYLIISLTFIALSGIVAAIIYPKPNPAQPQNMPIQQTKDTSAQKPKDVGSQSNEHPATKAPVINKSGQNQTNNGVTGPVEQVQGDKNIVVGQNNGTITINK